MSLLAWLPDVWKDLLRARAGAVTLRGRLANLRRAGFRPRRAIDAGAFAGHWARQFHEIFPETALLLVEPQPGQRPALEALCATRAGWQLEPVVLGREPGRGQFLLAATNSRIVDAAYRPAAGESVVPLAIDTLDGVAGRRGFADCDLLKLDLQGFELEALAGAGQLLKRVEMIFIEVSWLRIGPVPLVGEVIAMLEGRGFRLYDVLGFNYRPLDGALWQTDLIFVRQDSPLIASTAWGPAP